MSKSYVKSIRKANGFAKKRNILGTDNYNDVIDLIRENKYYLHEISKITGVSNQRIKEIRTKEIRGGNTLPELLIAENFVPRNTKYSDEDVITLAELNPGYGYTRFLKKLYPRRQRSETTWIFDLFQEFKEFSGIDLYEFLNDDSNVEFVSLKQYKEITGYKYAPQGYILSNLNVKKIPLRPQFFYWKIINDA
mgnify:CR=1 FL=1